MARIRTLKPEFWTDEKVVAISPLARLLFIGMWNFVDDYGRGEYSPARLKMQILPADPADINDLLAEISGKLLINVYTIGGKEYFEVCGFSKHQKLDHRTPSKFPEPTKSAELHQFTPEIALERKGKERKGKELSAASAALPISTPDKQLFDRGKEILGDGSGGLIKRLLTAKKENVQLAIAALEVASTKSNPREYIGAIVRGGDPPERTVDPRL